MSALPEQFGRYQIVRHLGVGGMGTVYLAHDTQLERKVALKVPQLDAEDGSAVLQRFQREARAAATLNHPNLCPVYDVGTQDGVPFLTMAYIEGRTLAEIIKDGRPMEERRAAEIVRVLAVALQVAHAKGVIHRDLKPANVMINDSGEPVVMDFGLARDSSRKTRLTQLGTVLGTPAYMAPEQVRGDSMIGPGCDIYALGVILYQLLTGRVPFDGPSDIVLAQILTQPPEPPCKVRPDVDRWLEAICLRALNKHPNARYPSMSGLAQALAAYLQPAGCATGAEPQGGYAAGMPTPRPARPVTARPALVAAVTPARTAPRALIALVGGVVALTGLAVVTTGILLAVWIFRSPPEQQSPQAGGVNLPPGISGNDGQQTSGAGGKDKGKIPDPPGGKDKDKTLSDPTPGTEKDKGGIPDTPGGKDKDKALSDPPGGIGKDKSAIPQPPAKDAKAPKTFDDAEISRIHAALTDSGMGQRLLGHTHPTGKFTASVPLILSPTSDRTTLKGDVTIKWKGVSDAPYDTVFHIEITQSGLRLTTVSDTALFQINPKNLQQAETDLNWVIGAPK